MAQLIEDPRMKTRYHRATPVRPIVREVHQAVATIRFRKWDQEMIRLHGALYYRAMRYTLH
jgi:hypothetical protein